ncbi:MAG: hypothetical protein NTZ46_12035, partial [Verrucomicrobia bacterium]|nr:hypothetical protein [Verrucomicrobiota bacterium]
KTKKLDRFTLIPPAPALVPRAFTVNKVVINEELLKPPVEPDPKKVEPPKTVVQNDKPTTEPLATDVRFSPNAPTASDLTKAISADKPRVEQVKIATPETNARIEREIDSIREALASKNAPKIIAGQETGLPASHSSGPEVAGYSNIDHLLAQAGPLTGAVAPIYQQGGALFEYDSATLRKEAIETLSKLGVLMERTIRVPLSASKGTPTRLAPRNTTKNSAPRAPKR